MAMSVDLVVFGEDWHGHPSSTQHLIKNLRYDRKIVWINSIGMRAPRVTARDAKRLLSKARQAFRPYQTLGPDFTVVSPTAIPLHGFGLAQKLNGTLIRHVANRAICRTSIGRRVLWISLPTAVKSVGTLGESAVVYYCGDDFSALSVSTILWWRRSKRS